MLVGNSKYRLWGYMVEPTKQPDIPQEEQQVLIHGFYSPASEFLRQCQNLSEIFLKKELEI